MTYEITKDLICDYKEIETTLCKIKKAQFLMGCW
jgi:hypothetical protein